MMQVPSVTETWQEGSCVSSLWMEALSYLNIWLECMTDQMKHESRHGSRKISVCEEDNKRGK
jgi:hypothetical protein